MANSILGGGGTPAPQGGMPTSGFNPQMMQQIKQFGTMFKGNPKQQVMNMMQQGMRSNEQLQQAMQMAQQMRGMFK